MPFLPKYDKQAAILLRKAGFSATEIALFLGCSASWVHSKVNTSVETDFQHKTMQLILDTFQTKVQSAD